MPQRSHSAHVVVVGASLGGLRTVEGLRRNRFDGSVTLVGDELHAPYDRPPLSKQVLAGQWPEQRATLRDANGLRELDVQAHLGTPAVAVDDRAVELADGTRLRYDELVVATGVAARRLPGQPQHPSIHTLRTLEDSRAIRAGLHDAESVLVVGAGFIGAEVAATARAAGKDVTIVEALPAPFARVLGEHMGGYCARLQTDNGVRLRCGDPIEGFDVTGARPGVVLRGGETLRADCIVVGVGTRPNTGWLGGLGIADGQRLPCDANGVVEGLERVHAVGDLAAWIQPRYDDRLCAEHWTSAVEQASVVARHLAGAPVSMPADDPPYFWSDQYGIKVQLVGRPELADEVWLLRDPGAVRGTVAGYLRGGTLVGALTFSVPKTLVTCRRLLAAQADAEAVEQAFT